MHRSVCGLSAGPSPARPCSIRAAGAEVPRDHSSASHPLPSPPPAGMRTCPRGRQRTATASCSWARRAAASRRRRGRTASPGTPPSRLQRARAMRRTSPSGTTTVSEGRVRVTPVTLALALASASLSLSSGSRRATGSGPGSLSLNGKAGAGPGGMHPLVPVALAVCWQCWVCPASFACLSGSPFSDDSRSCFFLSLTSRVMPPPIAGDFMIYDRQQRSWDQGVLTALGMSAAAAARRS